MDTIDVAQTFARLAETGRREESATIGGMQLRLVQVPGGGEGRWDSHAHTAETVLVWSGDFQVEFRDRTLSLSPGQCCVVPIQAEHRGTSKAGAQVILLTQPA